MADQYKPTTQRERNPLTERNHRREVFWQIYLPLIGGGIILLLLAAGVLITSIQGTARLDTWAAISEIFLTVPTMFAALIFLALIAGAAYLITRLLGAIPYYACLLQDIFVLIEVRVKKAADLSAEPFLRLHSFSAGLRALGRKR